jgi:hypothetical protein
MCAIVKKALFEIQCRLVIPLCISCITSMPIRESVAEQSATTEPGRRANGANGGGGPSSILLDAQLAGDDLP